MTVRGWMTGAGTAAEPARDKAQSQALQFNSQTKNGSKALPQKRSGTEALRIEGSEPFSQSRYPLTDMGLSAYAECRH